MSNEVYGRGVTFYGLSPRDERRCLEDNVLREYEPEHDYALGFVTMRDGTRLATNQVKAREAGWEDLASLMAERGQP